jgi:hypothetical protein
MNSDLVAAAALHQGSFDQILKQAQNSMFKGDLPPRSPRADCKPEPELLTKLLAYVRMELAALGSGGRAVDQRLEVFRRAFDHFISAFGSYQPLLLAIKQAYDDAYRAAAGDAADVQLLRSRLETMQSDSASVFAQLERDAAAEREQLQGQLAAKGAQLQAAKRAVSAVKLELATTRNTLMHAERENQEKKLQISQLVERVEMLQGENKDAQRVLEAHAEVVSGLRREGDTLRANQAQLVEQDAVRAKGMEQLKDELREMHSSWVCGTTHAQVKDALKASNALVKRCQTEVVECRRLLAGGESRLVFPAGLAYGDASLAGVGLVDAGWRGKRPQEVVQMLVDDLHKAITAVSCVPPASEAEVRASSAAEAGVRAPISPSSSELIILRADSLFSGDPLVTAPLAAPGGTAASAAKLRTGRAALEQAATLDGTVQRVWLRSEGTTCSKDPSRAFTGFARLRQSDWPRARVAGVAKKLVKLRTEAERRHGAAPSFAALLPSAVAQFGKTHLSKQADSLDATPGEDTPVQPLDGAATRLQPTTSGVPETHAALACADALDFQAALALADEPHALLFLHVYRGRLPPTVFAEMNRETSALRAGLLARGSGLTGNRYALEGLAEKLRSLLPSRTKDDLQALVAALSSEAAGSDGFPIPCLDAAPAEPMGDPIPPVAGSFRYLFQELHVREMLALRHDLEAVLRRAVASGLSANTRSAGTGSAHATGVTPVVLRACLLRVDAALPAQVLQTLQARVFDQSDTDAVPLGIRDVIVRLYKGPYRRYSPRADAKLCDDIEFRLLSVSATGDFVAEGAAKKGKKSKKDASAARVTVYSARDAIQQADPSRPPSEVAWLSDSTMRAAAREALGLSDGSPLLSGGGESLSVQVPRDEFVRQLRASLVQLTCVDAPERCFFRLSGTRTRL